MILVLYQLLALAFGCYKRCFEWHVGFYRLCGSQNCLSRRCARYLALQICSRQTGSCEVRTSCLLSNHF